MRVKTNTRAKAPLKANPPGARENERAKLEADCVLQNQLLATRDYAEAIIEAVPPLLVLDEGLRVHTANYSFCRAFQISQGETVNRRVYELGNGQWNIPRLRTLLEEVLPRKSFFKDFEVTHDFENIGNRTMLLSGRQVDHLQRILLSIEDITERRASQAAVRASELRYRRLFEAARDGILVLDPATRKITDANPFMTELLGYPHQELLGKELWEIGLLKDERASQAAFRELRDKHFIRYEDLPLQNKNGERHEVEFVSNLYDEDGRKVIQCNIRDITQRKQSELAFMRLAAIVEFSNDAIISEDTHGIVTSWNQGAAKMFGYSAGEMAGRSLARLIPEDRQGEEKQILVKIRRGETVNHVETERLTKDGRLIHVSVSISPIKGEAGKVIGVSKVARDITDRRAVQQALAEARNEIARHAANLEHLVADRTEELRQTVGELEEFSYSLSHDLRAPLRAMQSYSQFLLDEYASQLDERGSNYLHQIMRSSVRLDCLIQDVLSYAKLIHSPVPMEEVNLDRLVRDIIETYPNGQPIKPQILIQGTLPSVMGNAALLTQCVANLLANGAKFVSTGTAPVMQIWAEARQLPVVREWDGAKLESSPTLPGPAQRNKPPVVRLWFKDNGIGIAAEDHQRVVRLFERIHPATEYEGTGLGLTIVKKAVERMGAQFGFDSELGRGSQFWIDLTNVAKL